MAVYDVAVLGSGPGGYAAALHTAKAGLKTVIVEKQKRLGGTCTLVGCIPTKALLNSAAVFDAVRTAAEHGVQVGQPTVDMAAVLARKAKVVEQSSNGVSFLMKKNKIDVVHGFGRLQGPGKLEVKADDGSTQTIEYKNLILATGSSVREIPGLESDGKVVLNSDQILELNRVPKSLIVVGAGAVGMEFASVFASFGSKVTIVELLPHLLPNEDEEISKEVERAYRKRKIDFLLESKVEKIERMPNGVRATIVDKNGQQKVLEAEILLSAIGRKPNTEGIGLETVGITTERGFIPVDSMMRTKVPNVYAIGDIVPTPMLAHLAQHEAAVAADHIAGKNPEPVRYDRCPSATYCSPEVASVGLTERAAREKGYDVRVGKFPFSANGKARIIGETGLVKIVADAKYDEVLGVHIVGPHATDLIAEACAALRLEATSEDLVKTIHPHPTLSEAVGEAAFAVSGDTLHM
ncbi:MAG: dihydrolipoyl dehydrogenase [Pseudomonadota bacterium]